MESEQDPGPTVTVTDEMMEQAFRQAVLERGTDYIYPKGKPGWTADDSGSTCLYTLEDGTPACLIGVAAKQLDITIPHDLITDALDLTDPQRFYEDDDGFEMTELERELREQYTGYGAKWALSYKMRRALLRAQEIQDGGGTWGEAEVAFDIELTTD